MGGFKIKDTVRSKSKYSLNKQGVVYKISEIGVHVRFVDGLFEIFRFKKMHHKHSEITELFLIDSPGIRQLSEESELATNQAFKNFIF
jgi:hypothetical protein